MRRPEQVSFFITHLHATEHAEKPLPKEKQQTKS